MPLRWPHIFLTKRIYSIAEISIYTHSLQQRNVLKTLRMHTAETQKEEEETTKTCHADVAQIVKSIT